MQPWSLVQRSEHHSLFYSKWWNFHSLSPFLTSLPSLVHPNTLSFLFISIFPCTYVLLPSLSPLFFSTLFFSFLFLHNPLYIISPNFSPYPGSNHCSVGHEDTQWYCSEESTGRSQSSSQCRGLWWSLHCVSLWRQNYQGELHSNFCFTLPQINHSLGWTLCFSPPY